jgi:hypothetical protein
VSRNIRENLCIINNREAMEILFKIFFNEYTQESDRPTGRQEFRQTFIHADRHAGRQQTGKADKQTCIHADRHASRQGRQAYMQTHTGMQADRQTCIHADRHAGRPAFRQTCRQEDRPTVCRKFQKTKPLNLDLLQIHN